MSAKKPSWAAERRARRPILLAAREAVIAGDHETPSV